MTVVSLTHRRELGLQKGIVAQALPEHFAANYPKLVAFLDAYYEYLETDNTRDFAKMISDLVYSHDMQGVNLDMLEYAMRTLTLGYDYSTTLSDARLKAQQFARFYRTKGSLYSIETFFRWLYGEDVTIEYGKDKVFYLNHVPSQIGPASLRYIKNDKLYQTFALLIKVGVPISSWRDPYKQFVHPAGMYFQAEVVTESEVDLGLGEMTTVILDSDTDIKIGEEATIGISTFSSITGLYPDGLDSDSDEDRVDFRTYVSDIDSATTISLLANQYATIADLVNPNSPTFDDQDSDGFAVDFSNSIETMDQDKFD